jgi:hypothetical protein
MQKQRASSALVPGRLNKRRRAAATQGMEGGLCCKRPAAPPKLTRVRCAYQIRQARGR